MEEKARFDQVVHSIENNSFHDFAVLELKLHPDAVHHGRVGKELQIMSGPLAFETFDEEDGLHALEGNLAKFIVVRGTQSQDIRKAAQTLDEKTFEFLPLMGFDVTLEDLTAGLNDNFVELYFLAHPGPGATRRRRPGAAEYRTA